MNVRGKIIIISVFSVCILQNYHKTSLNLIEMLVLLFSNIDLVFDDNNEALEIEQNRVSKS